MKRGIVVLTCVLLPLLARGTSNRSASASLLETRSSKALFEAVQNDDQQSVAALIRKKADVNAREKDGATALAWAAMRCNPDIAKLLLKSGANPNLTNEQGVGPLYLAITNGSTEIVELLLASGAQPNVAREDGETALMTATRLGQSEVVKMLLKRGADVNAREKRFRPDGTDVGCRPPYHHPPASRSGSEWPGCFEGVDHHRNHLYAINSDTGQNRHTVEQ